MLDWSLYENFTEAEMTCKCLCGRADMTVELMDNLQALRNLCGFPLKVNSGFRCPDYNDRIASSGRDGPHTLGAAVDIGISGTPAHTVLTRAARFNFTGFGLSQNGPHEGRFIHLDTIQPGMRFPRPWVWSY
ncbi:MAG TPA: DUF882 domain-containing protein [Marinobacter sp.]|uniref:Peptidase M15A C-terminal domain-containing protein n=1 Tax=marine sediment metagenome TaxID=412755 RepID=A0A0F9NNQ3_9ZZZZ|nr:DUF882 domain-containing protein [Marinobacter sp.]